MNYKERADQVLLSRGGEDGVNISDIGAAEDIKVFLKQLNDFSCDCECSKALRSSHRAASLGLYSY